MRRSGPRRVGAGPLPQTGKGLYRWTSAADNVAVQNSDTFGRLELDLHPDGSYAWRFHPTADTFEDSGSPAAGGTLVPTEP